MFRAAATSRASGRCGSGAFGRRRYQAMNSRRMRDLSLLPTSFPNSTQSSSGMRTGRAGVWVSLASAMRGEYRVCTHDR